MPTLDSDTVDIVFARLAAVYGSRFANQWPSSALDEVKRTWSHELREFAHNLDAIDYALSHLPSGGAPMVLEFRDLARTHVAVTRAAFERMQSPVMTPEDRQRALDVLKSFRRPPGQHPQDWARQLRFRELSGERLTAFQRHAWRAALAHEERPMPSEPEARAPYDSTSDSEHA